MSGPTRTSPPPSGPSRRPPVDELSDIAWARVERRLWAELDQAPVTASMSSAPVAPRGRRWSWVAAAGAVAAAAVLAILVYQVSGRSGSHTLSPSSRVVTASAATEVSYGDATITVAPSSAVLMRGEASRGVAIVLERGAATFAVAPRDGRPPFMVQAGAVEVRVIGTRFTVTRSGDDARVDVAHGKVEVVARGHREVLLAGASWSSDGVREAAAGGSSSTPNPDGVAAAHFSADEVPLSPAAPAPVPPVTAPAPAPAPPPAELAAPIPRQTPSTPAAPPSTPSRRPPEPPPAVEPTPATPPSPPAPAASDLRTRFEAAEALESSDPAAALRAYRAVAAGDGAWAANALYAAARLSFTRGDRDLAARFARAYLTRFPRGANATDARRLLARVTGTAP